MNVNDVMINHVESCHPDCSLQDIAITMWNSDCGSVPIVDKQNKLIGIITDRDIAIGAALKHRPLWEISANEVTASRPVFSCRPDDDIHTALKIMRQNQVRRLPIVDKTGALKGILSIGDVIARTKKKKKKSATLPFLDTMTTLKSVFTRR